MKVTRKFAAQAHEAGRKVAHEKYGNPTDFTRRFKDFHIAQQEGMIALVQWALDNQKLLRKKRKP